jgi:hypothetical protein
MELYYDDDGRMKMKPLDSDTLTKSNIAGGLVWVVDTYPNLKDLNPTVRILLLDQVVWIKKNYNN